MAFSIQQPGRALFTKIIESTAFNLVTTQKLMFKFLDTKKEVPVHVLAK